MEQLTPEILEKAESILEKDQMKENFKFGYYYIDISGKEKFYYTLWRAVPPSPFSSKTEFFITNLSHELIEACWKAKHIVGKNPIILEREGTHGSKIWGKDQTYLRFGKYKGRTIGEVFEMDPNYIIYLAKEYPNFNKPDQNLLVLITALKDDYFKGIEKKNLQTIKSSYVGTIGDKIGYDAPLKLTCYNCKYQNFAGQEGNYKSYLMDEKENRFIIWNKKFEKDQVIYVKAKIKKHKEVLGVKFTELNYVKILNHETGINQE